MEKRTEAPLAGVLRVVYFLAIGAVALLVVVIGVTGLYEAPQTEFTFNGNFFEDGFEEELNERADYNRNVSMILMVISAGIVGAAVLALGSRFNALRTGLLGAGVAVYLTGVGFWTDASDDWVGFPLSILVFAVLAGSFPWLEDGLPLRYFERKPVRRLEIPPGAPPPPAPSAPAGPPAEGEPEWPPQAPDDDRPETTL